MLLYTSVVWLGGPGDWGLGGLKGSNSCSSNDSDRNDGKASALESFSESVCSTNYTLTKATTTSSP